MPTSPAPALPIPIFQPGGRQLSSSSAFSVPAGMSTATNTFDTVRKGMVLPSRVTR